jgi:hypothetical protein
MSVKSSSKLLGLSLLVGLGATACNPGNDTPCVVGQSSDGATIVCSNGSTAFVPNGATGPSGAQGVGAGVETTVIPDGDARCLQGNGGFEYITFIDYNNTGVWASNDAVTSTNYVCNGATGATGAMGATGSAGAVGATGATGAAGADGSSSSISLTAAGSDSCANGGWIVTVTNTDQSPASYPLCNGANGAAGATGATGAAGASNTNASQSSSSSSLSLIELIAPCGINSAAYKEELIVLSDGSLLGDFSDSTDGDETRLALIPDGTYEDTDDSGCIFTVSTSGSTRSVSWAAGSSSYEPSGWPAGSQSWSIPSN